MNLQAMFTNIMGFETFYIDRAQDTSAGSRKDTACQSLRRHRRADGEFLPLIDGSLYPKFGHQGNGHHSLG